MKKADGGYYRGARCGKIDKEFAQTIKWVCFHCGRRAQEENDL
jgi:DNA-directed RNA polymerase subunit RPC12/RpoP